MDLNLLIDFLRSVVEGKEIFGMALIPTVMSLVFVIRQLGMPSQYLRWSALVVGVALSIVADVTAGIDLVWLNVVGAGLASGVLSFLLYDTAANLAKRAFVKGLEDREMELVLSGDISWEDEGE